MNEISGIGVPFETEFFYVPEGYAIVIDHEGSIVKDADGIIVIARI